MTLVNHLQTQKVLPSTRARQSSLARPTLLSKSFFLRSSYRHYRYQSSASIDIDLSEGDTTASGLRQRSSWRRVRQLSRMATAATANGSNDDVSKRTQQPMLASQRAKQSQTPTEANRTGKISGGFFPLGYKDAVSQWVRHTSCSTACLLANTSVVGQCASCRC